MRGTVVAVALGALAWLVVSPILAALPLPIRFLVAWVLFTLGPCAIVAGSLTAGLDQLTRIVVLLGIGTAATPLLVDGLGRLGALAAFPYLALGGAAGGLWTWRSQAAARPRVSPIDLGACAVLVSLAVLTGAIAFSHRLTDTPNEVAVYGNYDSLDLAYYASITAESAHTVPPTASYYAGHALNYAYYPQLLLAMIHRFAQVPTLRMYFGYAWPTWLALGALTAFVLVRAIASTGAAFLAVLFMLIGGDFSYLAARLLPHATYQWDYLLWPTNFLAPTMEVLHFSSWTPTLPVFFVALFALLQAFRTGSRRWTVLASLLMAVLFQFKPFVFVVMMAAFGGAALVAWSDRRARAVLLETGVLSAALALPFVYRSVALYADRRSELRVDYFLLPRQMLIKLDLGTWLSAAADHWTSVSWLHQGLVVACATVLFLAGGIGVRWIGVPASLRALVTRREPDAALWRVLAWIALAGVVIPFVLVTVPYNDTLQFYQTGLYVLWIFAARAVTDVWQRRRTAGGLVLILSVAAMLPSSLHYLLMKVSDEARPPLATLSRSQVEIAEYLRSTDVEGTVVLHDRPFEPSLMAVVSERRVVLGWARYAVGSDERRREVDRFFGSADRTPEVALDILKRYHVTHVIEWIGHDRIHPSVLAAMKPVLARPDYTLYEVLQ